MIISSTKLTTGNHVAYVRDENETKSFPRRVGDVFSSYNKQWQDAQIAMADMLALEMPSQPRPPETVAPKSLVLIVRSSFSGRERCLPTGRDDVRQIRSNLS